MGLNHEDTKARSKHKPYPSYKDSGIEWLGDVPEHWVASKFGFTKTVLTDFTANGSFADLKKNVVYRDEKSFARLVRLTDLRKNLENANGVWVDEKGYAYLKKSALFGGEFLLANVGAYAGLFYQMPYNKGNATLAPNMFMAKFNSHKVSRKYMAYVGQSKGVNEQLKLAATASSAQPKLNKDDFKSIKFSYPFIQEQESIVDFLDQETGKMDLLIEKQQTMIALLKEKIISLAMNEQINGEGKLQRLRHLVHVVNRPVFLKDDEEYEALGLYNRGRGLFHKPKKPGLEMGDSDFYYVESGDLIISGQFAWEGAVTMATDNENGCVVSHRYPVIRGESLDTEYLLSLLFTEYGDFLLNESSRGSAGRNRPLNLNLLLNEKIRIPSRQAQDELKRLIKLKTVVEVKAEQTIALLKERKTALISAAVTGKIDVRGFA